MQAYAKAEREGNKSGMRNLQKARPDLFKNKVPTESPTPKKSIKRENRGEKDVYFIQGCHTKRIKIGVSYDPKNRLSQLVTSEPLELLGTIEGGGAELEKKLHKKFEKLRVHREWFKPEKELLEYIDNLNQ